VHQVITDARPTGYVILFTPEFLERNSIQKDFIANLKLFHSLDETPPLPLSDGMQHTLKIFADQIFNAFHSDNEMRFETIGAYLKLFLIECNGHCSLKPDSNIQNIEVGRALVKNFKEIVDHNFKKWHQVKDYADALNISPNYLNEVIRNSVHISAKDFIQNRIILEAKRLVIFTEKSGKEIGFDLGFDDPSHFSKFFKSNIGLSIQEFKESIR
jgi:AraC-like DNA-binding protein